MREKRDKKTETKETVGDRSSSDFMSSAFSPLSPRVTWFQLVLPLLFIASFVFSVSGCSSRPDRPASSGRRTTQPPAPTGEVDERAALSELAKWQGLAWELVRLKRMSLPEASRLSALLHVSIHDALQSRYGEFDTYLAEDTVARVLDDFALPPAGDTRSLTRAYGLHPELIVASASHTVLESFINRSLPMSGAESYFLDELDDSLATVISETEDDGHDAGLEDAVDLSRRMALIVLKTRVSDLDIGLRQPGRPAPGAAGIFSGPSFLLPGWGETRLWNEDGGLELTLVGPPPLTSQDYALSLKEVAEYGDRLSVRRQSYQTEDAFFFHHELGTSTFIGQVNDLAQRTSSRCKNSLPETVRFFATLNASMADAVIASWKARWIYYAWRPTEAVRGADLDGNDLTQAAPHWTPLVSQTPYPPYPSPEAMAAGAAATYLEKFFRGADFMEDGIYLRSESLPGVQRRYQTFAAWAEAVASSRIYGGVAFPHDVRDSLRSGREVGQTISKNTFSPISKETLTTCRTFESE